LAFAATNCTAKIKIPPAQRPGDEHDPGAVLCDCYALRLHLALVHKIMAAMVRAYAGNARALSKRRTYPRPCRRARRSSCHAIPSAYGCPATGGAGCCWRRQSIGRPWPLALRCSASYTPCEPPLPICPKPTYMQKREKAQGRASSGQLLTARLFYRGNAVCMLIFPRCKNSSLEQMSIPPACPRGIPTE